MITHSAPPPDGRAHLLTLGPAALPYANASEFTHHVASFDRPYFAARADEYRARYARFAPVDIMVRFVKTFGLDTLHASPDVPYNWSHVNHDLDAATAALEAAGGKEAR